MKRLEEQMKEFARQGLSKRRFEHVERVVQTLDSIARTNGLEPTVCRFLGWLHDSAKERPKEEFLDLVERGEIRIDPETLEQPQLWHGFHAAYIGKEEFGIADDSLLDAVRYHPTGSPDLCPEGVALFVADYSEPGRPMEWAGEIREQAEHDLMGAALRVVNEKIEYIQKKGRTPHTRSLAFRDWLVSSQPVG